MKRRFLRIQNCHHFRRRVAGCGFNIRGRLVAPVTILKAIWSNLIFYQPFFSGSSYILSVESWSLPTQSSSRYTQLETLVFTYHRFTLLGVVLQSLPAPETPAMILRVQTIVWIYPILSEWSIWNGTTNCFFFAPEHLYSWNRRGNGTTNRKNHSQISPGDVEYTG